MMLMKLTKTIVTEKAPIYDNYVAVVAAVVEVCGDKTCATKSKWKKVRFLKYDLQLVKLELYLER